MVKINGNSNAIPNWKAQDTSGVDPSSDPEKLDLLDNEIVETLAEMDDLDKWEEYLTDEQMAELARLKATLKAISVAIDGVGISGSSGSTSGTEGSVFNGDNLESLGSGWSNNALISQRSEHESAMGSEEGTYMGSITVDNYGGNQTNPLGLSLTTEFEEELMGPGGVIDEVKVKSQGPDLVFTVIGRDAQGNELRFSWVFVNGTVNSTPIVLNATELTHAISWDLMHATRISDGNHNSLDGVKHGFYVWGTDYNDVILGSLADDSISGQGGDDYIHGGAGNDKIYGDWVGDQTAEGGGDDTIIGGAGNDMLYGGTARENGDTRVESDTTSANNPGVTDNFENIIDDVTGAAPNPDDWFVGTGWDWSMDDGEVVIEQTDPAIGGSLEINLEDMQADGAEFTTVVASVRDGTDLVLEVSGVGANGEPIAFKIVIKDFIRGLVGFHPDQIIKLTINGTESGDIIDFSQVEGLTSQVVNLNGFGGDDILINPELQVQQDGLALEDLTRSSEDPSTVGTYVQDGIFYDETTGRTDEYNGYRATQDYDPATGTHEIVIEDVGPHDQEGIQIAVPEGYEHGYLAQDNNGDLLVIMVNPSTKETIVIRIPQGIGLDDFTDIHVGGIGDSPYDDETESWNYEYNNWRLMPISIDPMDYVIDGGDGNDIAYGLKGTKFEDVEQEIEGDTELQEALDEQQNSAPPEIPVETE